MASNDKKIPMYNANSVRQNFWNWFYFLENIALNVFEYKNCPANLPPREIERRLIEWGYCGIINHEISGVVACTGSLNKFDLYNYPTEFVCCNPVLGTSRHTINVDAVVIYGDSNCYFMRQSTALQVICKYARLLAESTSTIAITTKNSRAPVWAVATDETTRQSVNAYLDKIAEGDSAVICTDNDIFDTFKGVPAVTPSGTSIIEQWDGLERALRGFYRDYGIRYIEDKRERLITDEISAQDEVLFTNILDMYQNRKEGIERVNSIFGTSISVEISNGLKRGARANDIE